MGISQTGESELIRVSLVDYFTTEILLDYLVYPSTPMRHYCTRYSGVSVGMMEKARRVGSCILGRDAARQLVWQFVGPATIVVLHGGSCDLMSLRWIHHRVVDTFIVEGSRKEAQEKRSLKHLSEVILGRRIQTGRGGHDSVEDALASRELADWYVTNGM